MNQINDSYAFWVRLAARSSVAVAVMLLVLKLFAWVDSEASVMLATATDSLLDLFASVANLIILRIALSPPDTEHRFGHGKAESLGSMFQAAFISGSACLLVFSGIDRVLNPTPLIQTDFAVAVTITTVIITLLLVAFQQYVHKRTGSLAIGADMLHYKSDLLLNIAVLAALLLSQELFPQADGLFTIIIGVYLLFSASGLVKQSLNQLMDKALEQEDIQRIRDIVAADERALGIHELKTRQSGPTTFIQFHLELDDQMSLHDAHQVGEEIETKITELFKPCEVIIHHDPQSVVKRHHDESSSH